MLFLSTDENILNYCFVAKDKNNINHMRDEKNKTRMLLRLVNNDEKKT